MTQAHNTGFEFEEQAQRLAVKASIVAEGLSGDGKTTGVLMFAYALAEAELPKDTPEEEIWAHVGASDSEKRAMNLLVNTPIDLHSGGVLHVKPFPKANLSYFSPVTYKASKEHMIKTKDIKTWIADSYTHAWIGQPGGVLDLVSSVKDRQYAASPWNEPGVRENKRLLFDLLRDTRVHTIVTVRLKEAIEMVKETTAGGKEKTVIKSAGLQQVQQDMLKYEPDLGIRFIEPGKFEVFKTRYTIFKKGEVYELTWAIVRELARYLKDGVDPQILIEERRLDTIRGIKEMAKTNKQLTDLYKTLHPNKKTNDLTLTESKEVMRNFMEVLRG